MFGTIGVGRGTEAGDAATVPARVVRNDANDSEIHLALTARRASTEPHDWRITAIDRVGIASVPSEGGPRPSRASWLLWPAAGMVAFALGFGADLVVSRLRRRGPDSQPTEIDFAKLHAVPRRRGSRCRGPCRCRSIGYWGERVLKPTNHSGSDSPSIVKRHW